MALCPATWHWLPGSVVVFMSNQPHSAALVHGGFESLTLGISVADELLTLVIIY